MAAVLTSAPALALARASRALTTLPLWVTIPLAVLLVVIIALVRSMRPSGPNPFQGYEKRAMKPKVHDKKERNKVCGAPCNTCTRVCT